MLLRYASVSAAGTELKTIAPPGFADDADADICYTYEVNLKNGLFAADELVFLQLEDEEYYFKILPANGIADGSPNTACGKTAESTSGETAGATVRKIGHLATKRAERSLDTARDINVEAADETTCKTAGATMSEAADDAAIGATKEIASERADDALCEYKVFVRDYAEGEDRLFADDFYGFLEKF